MNTAGSGLFQNCCQIIKKWGEEMNIENVITWLNKNQGYNLDSDYYTRIAMWADWWKGYHRPFHQFQEVNSDNTVKKRELYTLKMAKKVCEDWAAILLNEKTEIVIKDSHSSEFLFGKDGIGGIFNANDFWQQANALMEKAFYSGTGAILVRIENIQADGEQVRAGEKTAIRFEYLSAQHIIPLTVRNGQIVEAAFVSEVLEKGKSYIYLEEHLLEGGKYVIHNKYFSNQNESLKEEPLPEGIAEEFRTNSEIPLFAIVRPNVVNHFSGNLGLGMSIYADAIDCLKGVDLAFNNFCRDLKLGGKKVFMNQSLVQHDEKGNVITPDDVAQQLFMTVGDEVTMDENTLIHEFNPDLRTAANKEAVQAQLDYLSFKVGFGTKHYQFNAGSVVTATQYNGDKQELIQNASKHYIAVEKFLQQICQAVLWAGHEIMGQNELKPDTQMSVNFEDSYIIDKESERQRDLQEVRDGLMQKFEYRMKWYGETEEEAKAILETQAEGLKFEE